MEKHGSTFNQRSTTTRIPTQQCKQSDDQFKNNGPSIRNGNLQQRSNTGTRETNEQHIPTNLQQHRNRRNTMADSPHQLLPNLRRPSASKSNVSPLHA